jgi:hypothetical protein
MSERDLQSASEAEPSVGDLVESAVRKIVTAIVIAGALIGLGLYWQPGPPRYQVIAADGRVFRINTKSGTIIGCEGDRCAIVLQRGQELEDDLGPPPAPRQLPPPAQAAPAPQIAPPTAPPQRPAPAPAPAAR